MLFWQHFTEIRRFHLKPPFSEDQSGYRNCALFCAAKNCRIYEFLYSQRLLRHDFNNFCSMWNKNRLSQQNICFANILTCRTGFYIKPNFWICTDFVFVFCFIDHFSEFLAAMKTPLYIGQRARRQKLHILYAQRKGSCLSKYCRYFSFRSLVKIFCLVQNRCRNACALVFLSAFTAYRNIFLSNKNDFIAALLAFLPSFIS